MATGSVVLLDARVTSSAPEADTGGPRQQWIDVTFPAAPVSLAAICFQNYYCAAITVSHTGQSADSDPLAQLQVKGRAPAWTVAVDKHTLMADPHCEDDAQLYHELTVAHFATNFDHRRVTRLRICCLQPSPSWREYGLRQLRFDSIERPPTPTLQPSPSLTVAERELSETVLEQLVGLGKVAEDIRETISNRASVAAAAHHGAASIPAAHASSSSADPSRRARSDVYHTAPPGSLAPYLVGEWNDELRLTGSAADHWTASHTPHSPYSSAKAASAAARSTSVRAPRFTDT
jgi:hypothetical protein